MEGKVRIGFIGCGKHATRDLYPNIARIPELELVATCDLIEGLAKRNAQLYGAKAYYTDFEKMLSEEELDAVMIVGSPDMHTELGVACLKHGVHIFVEKPIATTLEKAKLLVETADKVGKFGQVGHNMRHATAYKLVKRIIDSEEFGKPILIESKYFTPGPWEPWPQWGLSELDWTYMLVQGIHPIDLARHFMGEVVSVAGNRSTSPTGRQAFSVSMCFDSGAVGLVNLAASCPNWQTRLEIVGDANAVLIVENMMQLRYEHENHWAEEHDFNEPVIAQTWNVATRDNSEQRVGYLGEMEHFANCILTNTQPYPNLWDGYQAMVIAKAILESIKTGKVVNIPTLDN